MDGKPIIRTRTTAAKPWIENEKSNGRTSPAPLANPCFSHFQPRKKQRLPLSEKNGILGVKTQPRNQQFSILT